LLGSFRVKLAARYIRIEQCRGLLKVALTLGKRQQEFEQRAIYFGAIAWPFLRQSEGDKEAGGAS
jgi:hypothetical protein